jgi:hypothetical protein
VPKPDTLLDWWHAKRRLLDAARKTHGAHQSFCRDLTNAMVIVDPDAMEDLRVAVDRLNPNMEPREVQWFLLKNPSLVLKHAPRVIPPPEILIKRYDEVINLYRSIPDIVTGERFCHFLESRVGITCLIAFVICFVFFASDVSPQKFVFSPVVGTEKERVGTVVLRAGCTNSLHAGLTLILTLSMRFVPP